MDRFWILFILLAILIPVSAVSYLKYYRPFDDRNRIIDEGIVQWQPSDTTDAELLDSPYQQSVDTGKELRALFLAGDYQTVERVIIKARDSGYTPWYRGSWVAFYFRQLHDVPREPTVETDLKRAEAWLANSPDSSLAHAYIGDMYSEMGWNARGSKFRKDTTKDQFRNMNRNFKLAKKSLNRALELDPDQESAAYNLLSNARANCQREQITKVFNRAIEQKPNYYFLYKVNLSSKQVKWCGSYGLMFEFARFYAENRDNDPMLSHLLAQAHEYRASQYAREESPVDSLIEKFYPKYNNYWNRYYRYFRDDAVWQEYSEANLYTFERMPDYADGMYRYAKNAAGSGRQQTAKKYYQLAMEADAPFLGADKAYNVGVFFGRLDERKQAARYYRLFLGLAKGGEDRDKLVYANDYAGWIYAMEHRYQESLPHYQRVVDMEPNVVRHVANYCNALFNVEEYEKAEIQCERAIKMDPNHAWSYKILAAIYQRAGETQKSQEYTNRYRQLDG